MSSSDLWTQVMNFVVEKHPEVSLNWRQAALNKAECMHCVVLGGGPLIKCSNEKCKKEYHIECGFRKGVFFCTESANLTFQCESHFKPVLFCKCLQPYDASAAMICCDECIEWFHNCCVGVSSKEAQKLEKWVCEPCSKILQDGKALSLHIKSMNTEKEKISGFHQEGMKKVRVLVEVAESVCPLIDQLNSHATVHKTDKKFEKFSAAQMKDAADYLEKYPLFQNSKSGDQDLIALSGAKDLINIWRYQLKQFVEGFSAWSAKAMGFIKKMKGQLIFSLRIEFVDTLNAWIGEMQSLVDEAQILHVPPDVNSFITFANTLIESWTWFKDLFQIIHSSSKSPAWPSDVNTHYRQGHIRVKRLHQLASTTGAGGGTAVGNGLGDLATLFEGHVASCAEPLSEMCKWCRRVDDLVGGQTDSDLDEINTLVAQTEGFIAFMPQELLQDLVMLQSKGAALEARVSSALEQTIMNEEDYETLQTEVSESLILITATKRLDAVGNRLNFLQNYRSMVAQDRILFETIEQLRILSSELLHENLNETISSTLSKALDSQIQSALLMLEGLCAETENLTALATDALQRGEVDSTILAGLKSLRVVTAEERALIFLKDGAQAISQATTNLNPSANTHQPEYTLEEFSALREAIEVILDVSVVEEYPATLDMRTRLQDSYDRMCDQEETAKELWHDIHELIALCMNEKAIDSARFNMALTAAKSTNLVDMNILRSAEALLSRAVDVESFCREKLPAADDVSISQVLLKEASRVPLDEGLMAQIVQRNCVCEVAGQCREKLESLESSSVGDDAAVTSDGINPWSMPQPLPISEIFALRELRQSLDKLTNSSLCELEREIIGKIYDRFLVVCLREEIRYLLSTRAQRSAAEIVLEMGKKMGSATNSLPEWSLLCDSMAAAFNLAQDVQEALGKLDEAKMLTNAAMEGHDKAEMEMVNDEAQENIKATGFALSDKDLAPFIEGATMWQKLTKEWNSKLHNLLGRETIQKISQPNLASALLECVQLLQHVKDASKKITDIHIATMSTHIPDEKTTHIVDFRDLTTLANALSIIAEKQGNHMLIKKLLSFLLHFHAEATRWQDLAQSLLPAKATRRKLKSEVALSTVDTLRAALAHPIARAIKLPMYEKLSITLGEAEKLFLDLREFLIPERRTMAMEGKLQQGGVVYTDSNYDKLLLDDVNTLIELQARVDLIPLDLLEAKLVIWLQKVFAWLQGVPVRNSDSRPISMEMAKQRIHEAIPIIVQIPPMEEEALIEIGVLLPAPEIFVPSHISCKTRFSSAVHPRLATSREILDNLREERKRTVDLQQRILTAISASQPQKALRALLEEMNDHLVQPEVDIRKALESAMGGVGATGSKGDIGKNISGDLKQTRKRSRTSDERSTVDIPILNVTTTGASSGTQLSSPRTKEKPLRKGKSGIPKCASPSCLEEASYESAYCSDVCAIKCSPELLQGLLKYRQILCDVRNGEDSDDEGLASLVEADRAAFSFPPLNILEAHEAISSQLAKRGLLSCSEDLMSVEMSGIPGTDETETDAQNVLREVLVDTENLHSLVNSSKARSLSSISTTHVSVSSPEMDANRVPTDGTGNTFMKNSMQWLLGALPAAAASILTRDPDKTQQGVISPSSSPRGQGSAAGGGAVFGKDKTQSGMASSTDLDIRRAVRFNFEDVFVAALSRLQVNGSCCQGAIIAAEVEMELYQKYTVMSTASGVLKRELNRKEYKKHQMMLLRNLKHQHNDQLILRLVRYEVSPESLLGMTASQLADADRQAARAEQINSALQESRIAVSTQEALGAATRVAMSGQEAWRTKGAAMPSEAELLAAAKAVIPQSESSGCVPDILTGHSAATDVARVDSKKIYSPSEGQEVPIIIPSTEESFGLYGRGIKRPLDIDGEDTMKRSNFEMGFEEGPDCELQMDHEHAEQSIYVSQHKEPKGPNVLDHIKASSHTEFKLLNINGMSQFSVMKHGSPSFECIFCASDRRLLGLIKNVINIEGRTKIHDLEKFLLEVKAQSRKVAVPFRIYAAKNLQSSSGFHRFVEEFSRDRRAGVCNSAGLQGVQLYIVPPSLQSALSMLREFNFPTDKERALYGIAITKEVGPPHLTNAAVQTVDLLNPPEPLESVMAPQTAASSNGPSSTSAPSIAPSLPLNLPEGQQSPLSTSPSSDTSASMHQMTQIRPVELMGSPPLLTGHTVAIPSTGVRSIVPVALQGQQGMSVLPRASILGPLSLQQPSPFGAVHLKPLLPQFPTSTSQTRGGLGSGARAPSPPPPPVSIPMIAPVAVIGSLSQDETIRKVAMFCAEHGVQTLQILREKQGSREMMPFLFDGQPGHTEFLDILKSVLYSSSIGSVHTAKP